VAVSFAQAALPDSTLTTNIVFQKNCAKCHGKTAQGRHFRGPSLISDKITTASDDFLRETITNGMGRNAQICWQTNAGRYRQPSAAN
jgi:mono/diheme cytochrome c family protein